MNITDHNIDDQILLERLIKSDDEAFSMIYSRYHALLYTFILRYIKNTVVTEDILQQVFVKLWEIREALFIHTALKNYLYTMARNMALNYIRNSYRALQHNYIISQIIPDTDDCSAQFSSDPSILDYLERAILQLPPQQRNVVAMRREGLTNKEIAEKMSLSVNTVNTHYRDGLKTLRITLSRILLTVFILIFSHIL